MKIVSWGIIFVIVIFSFSFINRVIMDNKMEIMKEEVKYNNVLELATADATSELRKQMNNLDNGIYGESSESMLTVAKTFFNTLTLGFGYYGGNSKESIVKMYVPALAIMTYDGFYMYTLDYLENAGATYLEHTLKPEVKYAYNDGKQKINFTLDNTVILEKEIETTDFSNPKMIWTVNNEGDPILEQEEKNGILQYEKKDTKTGKVVDLNHYYDIEVRTEGSKWDEKVGSNTYTFEKIGAVCVTTNEKYTDINGNVITLADLNNKITYEKSFYNLNGIKNLLEQWYNSAGDLIDQRLTEYTDEQIDFSESLENKYSEYKNSITYLTRGNSENEGFINPLSGEYEIGEFHKVRRETITSKIRENLEYYILLHNKFAQSNGITYTFTVPEIQSTDWENAIEDMSVFAFLQGIPLVNGKYYNNYGVSGAKIIEQERFYGLPSVKPANFTLSNIPTYYSNRVIGNARSYLFERNNAKVFNSAKEAAEAGYYPNITGETTEIEKLEEEVWNIKIDKTYLTCLTEGGNVHIPIEIDGDIRVSEIKWWAGSSEISRYKFVNNSFGNKITNYIYNPGENKTTAEIIASFNPLDYGITGDIVYFTIFVRDVDGNYNTTSTGKIDIMQDNFSLSENTPYPSYDNPNNNITMTGRTNNRNVSSIMKDNTGTVGKPMVYYVAGHVDATNYSYDILKTGGTIAGVYQVNLSGSTYSFSDVPGKYTVFAWDCTKTFRQIQINSTGSFVFRHEGNTLYDASNNVITGAGTVTKARINIQTNRRVADIETMKYIKCDIPAGYTASQMRSISGATAISSSTYDSIYSTLYFDVTENGYYTVYAKDRITNEERVFVVNMIGIGSDKIIVTMTWTNGPDLDFHLEGKDAGGTDFHIYYNSKTHYYNSELIADLPNGDITHNNDTERVTLYKPAGGEYTFYVVHYSGSNIGGTGAVLRIYRGEENNASLVQTLNVPTGAYKNWRICTYDADTRNLIIHNTLY